jgi:nitronate monooxygenase
LHDLNLPLVCAGGVGDEKDFEKALKMGYAAVQMGTRFLATKECQTPNDYKEAIVNSEEKDIVWTNKIAGVNSSVILTPDIEKLGLKAGPITSKLLKGKRTKKWVRNYYMLRSMFRFKKVANKPGYAQYWQAGKGVGAIHEIEPAADILKRFHVVYSDWIK